MLKRTLLIASAAALQLGIAQKIVADSRLIALYEFEGNFADTSGYGTPADGVGSGAAVVVSDPVRGNVLSVGLDGRVSNAGNNKFDYPTVSNQLTLTAWVKTTDDSGWGMIAGWRQQWGYKMAMHVPGGGMYGTMALNNNSAFSSKSVHDTAHVVSDGQWHHYAMVFSPGTSVFYRDGSRTETSGGVTGHLWGPEASTFDIGYDAATPSVSYTGLIDDVRVYNGALSDAEILAIYSLRRTYAWGPTPRDGDEDVSSPLVLGWTPAQLAISNSIYLGTSFEQVDSATPQVLTGDLDKNYQVNWGDIFQMSDQWLDYNSACPGAECADLNGDGSINFCDFGLVADQWKRQAVYRGRTVSNFFDTHGLEPGITYYWRIDSITATTTHKGDVWSFTPKPLIAYNPSPEDESAFLNSTGMLEWSLGAQATVHDIYFGTNFNDVKNASILVPMNVYQGRQTSNAYSFFGLKPGIEYFWRIDGVNGDFIWKGDVWNFGTFMKPVVQVNNLLGVPTFQLDDQWVTRFNYSTYPINTDYIRDFSEAGVFLSSFISTATAGWGIEVWRGPETFDYSSWHTFLDTIIGVNSNAFIMPRIYIETPQWWLDDPINLGEMEVMDDGTNRSIYFERFESQPGILPRRGPFPSLASPKWREDMARGIERAMDYLASEGYAKNIGAFEMSGLGSEEWYHWSLCRQELAGYSAPTINAFREWLRTKYGNDIGKLRAAWSDQPTVTFDNAQVPNWSDRMPTVARTFRDTAIQMDVIDFYQFWSDLVVDTQDYFAGVIKNKIGNSKPVGAFYGFMYEFLGNPEAGHNALGKYIRSENLDFVYVTASLATRDFGTGSEQLRAPAHSVALHDKLWYHDQGFYTILAPDILQSIGLTPEQIANELPNGGYTDTVEKNRWMFRRDSGFALENGMTKNFLDLHGGYYHHPELMAEITSLNAMHDRSKNYDRSSASQILIVSDEVSCFYPVTVSGGCGGNDNQLLVTSLKQVQLALNQIGAPADHILVDDISLIDAYKYKLIVFLNCWNLTTSQRALVDSLKGNSRVLVFCYAPGYFNNRNISITNMQTLTGMTIDVSTSETFAPPRVNVTTDHALGQAITSAGVSIFGPANNVCKRIWVNDGSATRLGYDPNFSSHKTMAIKNMGTWESVYCVTSDMPAAVFRELARYAGVHIYNDRNDTLYVSKAYICIHANGAGDRTIKWPQAVRIYDALTEAPLQNDTTTHTRTYQNGETMIYRYELLP